MWSGLLRRPIGAAFDAEALLVVRRSLDTTVLTHWEAPYTDGISCQLPEGTRLRVVEDTGRRAKGLPCRPEDRDSFERLFVDEAVRSHPKYAGCSLVLTRRDLEACELRAEPPAQS